MGVHIRSDGEWDAARRSMTWVCRASCAIDRPSMENSNVNGCSSVRWAETATAEADAGTQATCHLVDSPPATTTYKKAKSESMTGCAMGLLDLSKLYFAFALPHTLAGCITSFPHPIHVNFNSTKDALGRSINRSIDPSIYRCKQLTADHHPPINDSAHPFGQTDIHSLDRAGLATFRRSTCCGRR